MLNILPPKIYFANVREQGYMLKPKYQQIFHYTPNDDVITTLQKDYRPFDTEFTSLVVCCQWP